MLTTMLLLDVALAIIVGLLGNELRLIIDEKDTPYHGDYGQHSETRRGTTTAARLVRRHQRAEEDRELFARIAEDFARARVDWHTDRLDLVGALRG